MFYRRTLNIALALITIFVAACDNPNRQPLTIPKSKPPAPEFSLQDISGKQYSLADYRGRVVVINFWASWCPPCVEEMPSMQRAADALAKHDITILGIGVGENRTTVAQFLKSTPVRFPLLLDTKYLSYEKWSIPSLPTTIVVDQEGKIALLALGGREWDSPDILEQIIALQQTP